MTICHRPPGNPDNEHTITVGAPAWAAHERHGDSQGACEDDADGDEDDDGDEEDGPGQSRNRGRGHGRGHQASDDE